MPTGTLGPAAIALNRFGLGARPQDALPADPKRWLHDQFDRFVVRPPYAPRFADAVAVQRADKVQRREFKTMDREAKQKVRRAFTLAARAAYRDQVAARARSAVETEAPFIERLVHFWANHFALSADRPAIQIVAGSFEADAIRPHVLGRFEDMVQAAEHHPAMLVFLDQTRSAGPNSPEAERRAKRARPVKVGLNENLGREAMELHTLGVRTGYTQADVTEMALALTGWTVAGLSRDGNNPDFGSATFRPELHEPGTRPILGRRFDQPGPEQANAALSMLANAPATATHIATKLARHFAGDDPPPALVSRLAAAFTDSGGDLPTVYRALIDAPEPWAPRPLKFKTPWEWTISSLRALGPGAMDGIDVQSVLGQLGQPVWRPGSPAGFDDIAASWAAPNALLRRVAFAPRLVSPVADRLDPRRIGPAILPGALSVATAEAIAHAESPTSGLSLLLLSPDFMRR